MKSTNKYVVKVLATGFVTLVVLSILLFWARKTCQAVFYGNLVGGKMAQVKIQPSGLLPELDNAPEVIMKSSIDAYTGYGVVSHGLGIVRNIEGLEQGKSREFCWLISRDKKKGNYNLILFDKNSGLFVFYDVFKAKRGWDRKVKLYAGPKGVSETADKNLGRFSEPRNNPWRAHVDSLIFFDKLHSCFFQIRFVERTVDKSLQLSEVVQIGEIFGFAKGGDSPISLTWSPPLRKQTPLDEKGKIRDSIRDKDRVKINLVSAAEERVGTYSKEDILILESDGAIRRLNIKTLEISGPVGFLPSAIDSGGRAKPEELFAYAVQPFVMNDEYAGTIAASISREASGIRVAVFDKDGNLIEGKRVEINPFSMAGGPALTITNYLLENLQPAFLGLVSYFTASTFEAVDGHTGLFILPNSTVAMVNRYSKGIVGPLFLAMIVISPSIVLGLLLGFAVYKDATVTGFSKRAKRYWLFGTILFGLSAYIAYRLTKPKEILVTCQNCGKMRRPDMLRCHRCGSKWQVPELIPPTWRVITESDKKVAG